MNKKSKCYCHKCNKLILFEDLNSNEREEFLSNNFCFVCSECIDKEMNEEEEDEFIEIVREKITKIKQEK